MTDFSTEIRELSAVEVEQVVGAVIEPLAEPLTAAELMAKLLYDATHPLDNLTIH